MFSLFRFQAFFQLNTQTNIFTKDNTFQYIIISNKLEESYVNMIVYSLHKFTYILRYISIFTWLWFLNKT